MWYVSGAIIGFCMGFNTSIGVAIVLENWFAKKTGFAIGMAWGIGSHANAIMSPIISNVIATLWRGHGRPYGIGRDDLRYRVEPAYRHRMRQVRRRQGRYSVVCGDHRVVRVPYAGRENPGAGVRGRAETCASTVRSKTWRFTRAM